MAETPKTPLPQATLDALSAKVEAIASSDAAAAGPAWGALHQLLLKAKVPPKEIMPLVAGRDLAGMRRLIARLAGAPIDEPSAAPMPSRAPIDPDTLAHAMRAFRNRLKVTRLDAESKLGVGPMSSGRRHGIDAIIPPREYPLDVWETLADEGKLRRAGGGFYGLAEEA